MKIVYLLRHAKSSWDEVGLSDKQRPLAKRGLRDAPNMGARFAERNEVLDRVISSPAVRARSTAQLFCEACGFSPDDITIDDDLYFLGSGSIQDVILGQDEEASSIMLVFHNPDITYFANAIDYDVRIDNVPTSGLVKITCEVESWSDWSPERARFDYFDYPKNPSADVVRQ